MTKTIFIVFFVSLVAGVILMPVDVYAVTVGPGKLDYSADPGDTISGELFLMNEGNQTQTFYAVFEKFIEVGGEKKFLPGEPTELTNWFKMPSSVKLGPKEQRVIPFTIELPNDAPPGGHFAVIWWSTSPPTAAGRTSIVTRAGILVFLRVSGDIIESGRIVKFSTAGYKRFFSRLPVKFTIVFENSGNVHLKPFGTITIKNILGMTKASFAANQHGLRALPKTEKTFAAVWDSDKWGGFAFGLYKAKLNLIYGEEEQKAKEGFWFFMFPWKVLLIAILALTIVFFGLIKGIKKYNQWIISKYSELKQPRKKTGRTSTQKRGSQKRGTQKRSSQKTGRKKAQKKTKK